MQNRNYRAEGNKRQQRRGQQGGLFSLNIQHMIDHSPLLFAAPIGSIHHNRNNSSLQEKNTHQDISEISGQSVQAKNVSINATGDMFLTFTMVQEIMTELSGAATGTEKFAVTTKPAYRFGNSETFLAAVHKSPQILWPDTDIRELLGFRNMSILAGDHNAKHPVWNSKVSNPSGLKHMKIFANGNFEISGPQCSTRYTTDSRGDVLDIVAHQKVGLSEVIVTDGLVSYRLKF
jgi:hypothetical protein